MERSDIFRFYGWRTYKVVRFCEDCEGPCKNQSNSYMFPITKNFRRYIFPKEYNKVNVTISRSIRNLFFKGYIDVSIGWFGGFWVIKEQKEALKSNIRDLEAIKKTGQAIPSPFGDESLNTKHFEDLIESRKKVINHEELWDSIGHNIKKIKLTEEGKGKAKSLLLSTGIASKLNNKEKNCKNRIFLL